MHILHLPEVPSTMDVARQLVAQGDATTQAVLADVQTNGRGRLGRVWRTFPAPHSMACTFIIRTECAHLPLVVAWALHQALITEMPQLTPKLTLKWPNDVLLNGQKVAGILCESLNMAGVNGALVGVGLNLHAPLGWQVEHFMGAFIGSQQKPAFWAEKVASCLFAALGLYQTQGWAAFHNNYARACTTLGQQIVWRGAAGNQELTGLARGLNQQGHLELVTDDGTVHIIHSGEIVAQGQHLSPYTAKQSAP